MRGSWMIRLGDSDLVKHRSCAILISKQSNAQIKKYECRNNKNCSLFEDILWME